MSAKPNASNARWAETVGGTPASNLTAPAGGQRDTGWTPNQIGVSSYFNSLAREAYLWARYLSDGALSGAHTFDSTVGITGALSAASAALTGAVTAASGAFTGALSAASATISPGNLVVTTGNLSVQTGSISANGSISTSSNLSCTGDLTVIGDATISNALRMPPNQFSGDHQQSPDDGTIIFYATSSPPTLTLTSNAPDGQLIFVANHAGSGYSLTIATSGTSRTGEPSLADGECRAWCYKASSNRWFTVA